jgi:hypothetical protein
LSLTNHYGTKLCLTLPVSYAGSTIVNMHTIKIVWILGKLDNSDMFLLLALYHGQRSSKKTYDLFIQVWQDYFILDSLLSSYLS